MSHANVPCVEAARNLEVFRVQLANNPPPPVPGDDALPTFISIRDDSPNIEVVGIGIAKGDRVGSEFVYVGLAPDQNLEDGIKVYAGEGPSLIARVLLRVTVRGGLFEHLTYCYEHFASVHLPKGEQLVELVIAQPQGAASLRGGSIARFEPTFPSPLRAPEEDEDRLEGALGPSLRSSFPTARPH